MTVAGTTVEVEVTNIATGVPFVVGFQLYSLAWVFLYYGDKRLAATPNVDYTAAFDNPLDPSYLSVTITPQASLLAKIAIDGPNVVFVRRMLPLTTDFDFDDAFVREKLVTENDKTTMKLQQIDDAVGELTGQSASVVTGPSGATDNAPVLFAGASGFQIKQTTYPAFKISLVLVKADVGLGNVDNTSDVNKPVSTAQAASIATKAPLSHVTDFANPHVVTKAQVGLGFVDNTSDINKPVSTAQANADALKANIASPTLTGVPAAPTAAAATNTTQLATTQFVRTEITNAGVGSGNVSGPATSVDLNPTVFSGVTGKIIQERTYPQFKTSLALVKGDVGLGNVDNTSDANKPVSTAQAAAIALKADLASPVFTGNPTTPAQADYDNDFSVPNTAFVQKHVGLITDFKNLLINPHGRIQSRGSIQIGDDTYGHDRWYALTQTGAVNISSQFNQENGNPSTWALYQSQAVAQRYGYAQIIEGLSCKHLRGKQATLSGRIWNTDARTIRYAILEWTGTEDAVTSDVVNNWASATYTNGNFFLATASLGVLAVGSIAVAAGTHIDLIPLTANIGGAMNNIIVFIWTEQTAPQVNTLQCTLQFEQGPIATARDYRPIPVESSLCRRYYERLTTPAIQYPFLMAFAFNTVLAQGILYYAPKRVAPAVTISLFSHFELRGADVYTLSGMNASSFEISRCRINGDTTGMTAGGSMFFRSANAAATINIDAEL